MNAATMKQMNEWEQKYHDITELYALSEDLLGSVEVSADGEKQLDLVEPLIDVINDGADVLGDAYITLLEGTPKSKQLAKSKIETALRKMYVAVHEFTDRTKNDSKNAAIQVVKKIRRQLEQIVANFVEFVTLSLDRIMQKHDVEELKKRQATIALMLHQMGQGA